MIAQRTPDADEPNGDGWLGQPHPFNADLAAVIHGLRTDLRTVEQDREAWRAWGAWWRRLALVFGVLAASGWLVAALLFVTLGAR